MSADIDDRGIISPNNNCHTVYSNGTLQCRSWVNCTFQSPSLEKWREMQVREVPPPNEWMTTTNQLPFWYLRTRDDEWRTNQCFASLLSRNNILIRIWHFRTTKNHLILVEIIYLTKVTKFFFPSHSSPHGINAFAEVLISSSTCSSDSSSPPPVANYKCKHFLCLPSSTTHEKYQSRTQSFIIKSKRDASDAHPSNHN